MMGKKQTFKDICDGTNAEIKEVNGWTYKTQAERLILADGESISVQASETHYCNPRENYGSYYEVECGFPSCVPQDEMLEYAEERSKPCDTVYGYVPIAVVQDFIDLHGGESTKVV